VGGLQVLPGTNLPGGQESLGPGEKNHTASPPESRVGRIVGRVTPPGEGPKKEDPVASPPLS